MNIKRVEKIRAAFITSPNGLFLVVHKLKLIINIHSDNIKCQSLKPQ